MSEGFNESLFKNFSPTVLTLRWHFQYVIRHTRISAGDAIEYVVEWHLRAVSIAVLTRFDQALSDGFGWE